jgi:hypothetical protein
LTSAPSVSTAVSLSSSNGSVASMPARCHGKSGFDERDICHLYTARIELDKRYDQRDAGRRHEKRSACGDLR